MEIIITLLRHTLLLLVIHNNLFEICAQYYTGYLTRNYGPVPQNVLIASSLKGPSAIVPLNANNYATRPYYAMTKPPYYTNHNHNNNNNNNYYNNMMMMKHNHNINMNMNMNMNIPYRTQIPSFKSYYHHQHRNSNANTTFASHPTTNRYLSLSTIFQFPYYEECKSNSGDNGNCISQMECMNRRGIPTGPCHRNFGICCVSMATCGKVIQENGTYFVNPGYPASYNGTGSCQLTINKLNPDICQYKLEFQQFIIAGPEPKHHTCNYDQFVVSGAGAIPVICGYNTDHHVYLDAGQGNTGSIVLMMITSGPTFPRNWKIRITQIPCSSNYKADYGCLQYFTGVSGVVKSFNYDATIGLHLPNQDYSICVRSERNFCGIQYSPCPDYVNNRSQSFSITGNTLGQNVVESMIGGTHTQTNVINGTAMTSSVCNSDWLMIPCISDINKMMTSDSNCVDRICGGTLNTEIKTSSAVIYSNVKPFRLVFHTNDVEYPLDKGNKGFCLNYVQQPCK